MTRYITLSVHFDDPAAQAAYAEIIRSAVEAFIQDTGVYVSVTTGDLP